MRIQGGLAAGLLLLTLCCFQLGVVGGAEKAAAKKKNPADYTDADLERLSREWEDEEERGDPDNYPPRPKPQPTFDPSKLQAAGKDGAESILKESKKGQTLMVFVKLAGNPPRPETDKRTGFWEESLRQGGILVQRYIVSDDKAIFMIQDGSDAWKMKDFLIEQEGVLEVEIEQKKYPGKKPFKPKMEL